MNLTYLEYAANGFYLLAVGLAARNNIHNWPFGIIGCALFAALFYQVNLYAEVALMLFFIAKKFLNSVPFYQDKNFGWVVSSEIMIKADTKFL